MYTISKVEMFIDHYLIETTDNTILKLHEPVKKNKIVSFDAPCESITSCYITILNFKGKYYMYYRGYSKYENKKRIEECTCLALSDDGINFYKPNLNLVEFNGNKNNNIILKDAEICHNFTPFIDTNPNCDEKMIIKAVGGHKKISVNKAKLYGLYSADGINFKKIQEQPILTDGMFDSQNVVFYDNQINKYRCYSRYFDNSHIENPKEYEGVRAIQSCTSDNLITWDKNIKNKYNTPIMEQFYTNATSICPDTNIYLSFPKRYVHDRERDFYNSSDTGVSDCVFMSSRDGINFDRTFLEAYVRPGLDRKNWVNRNNMMALGIVETSDNEFSIYISENYRTDTAGIRRLAIRKYGFCSMHANYEGGSFLTKPFNFTKNNLYINYSTSAVGFVKIQLVDEAKKVLATSKEIYGDEIFEKVEFDNDISKYINRPVRLLVQLKDSDIFAFKFEEK